MSTQHGILGLDNWLDHVAETASLTQVEQLLQTVPISSGIGLKREWETSRGDESGSRSADIDALLAATYTDSIVVARGGQIEFEAYRGVSSRSTRHLGMSVSKSICGMLAGVLLNNGSLTLSAHVSHFVPELAGGAYGDATVAQLLDMRVPVRFSMDHTDSASEVNQEDRAAGWRPRLDGDSASSRDFLTRLARPLAAGEDAFQYCSATTEVLSWVLERASGVDYPQLVSEILWSRMGAESDAFITVDAAGVGYSCAGIGMTTRDLATFGRLILDGGSFAGEPIIPTTWIAETFHGPFTDVGPNLFAETYPNGGYHNQWWITGDERGTVMAHGLSDQYLWLDPSRDIVIAKFSSAPIGSNQRDPNADLFERLIQIASR